jgi:hypothetical protein
LWYYVVLKADKQEVHPGESVEIVATLVNPTARRLMLPQSGAWDDGGHSVVDHQGHEKWNGSSGGFFASSVNGCPPSVEYLEPGQQRAYRLKWKSHGNHGKGVVEIEFEFGSGKDFPPATLRLKTR